MGRYILNKLLTTIPVLLGVSLITFGLIRLIPGDPIQVMLGTEVQGNRAAELRQLYGLDRPWLIQYGEWLVNAVQGNLGKSIRSGEPITSAILVRLPVTLQLTFFSIIIGLLIGLPLAILSARKRGTILDSFVTGVALLGISMPGFWLATLLVLMFSIVLRWFPPIGYVPLFEDVGENLRHLLLPAISLGLAFGATIMRFTRSSLLEVYNQDYVRTARAKGLSSGKVTARHALKNALIPVITVTGIQIGRLLGGTVIIEQIFALPGIGRYVFDAISTRDYPVVQGTVLIFTVIFILVNLGVDLLYGIVDPRIKFSEKSGKKRGATA
jgi:peptide/nickel transport system permease protein